MKIKSKVWLEKEGQLVFGSGKALILKAINEEGSINKAAKKMKMSYRHAWSYIRAAEKRIGKLLVIKTKGGKDGGGAILTDYAKDLLRRFENIDRETKLFADKLFKKYF